MTEERVPGIYARTSTTDQSLASQMPELKAWDTANGGKALWFSDQASGTNMKRPGLEGLIQGAQSGCLDRIVIWRIDRLGRACAGVCKLIDDLLTWKVNLVSLRDGFNLETPAGRCMARMLASFAELENEVRRERQTAGIAAAKLAGKVWGGSQAGRVIKLTQRVRNLILDLHQAGNTVTTIARACSLSRNSVYQVLQENNLLEQPSQ